MRVNTDFYFQIMEGNTNLNLRNLHFTVYFSSLRPSNKADRKRRMRSHNYILFFLLLSFTTFGQNGLNSPFSRFGLGDLNDPTFMHLRQMGNIYSSFADAYHINTANPASYSFLKAATFEVGLETRFSQFKTSNQNENTTGGQLSYLGLAFPLRNAFSSIFEGERKKYELGMAFGLQPVSTVAYNVVLDEENENTGQLQRIFRGDGGTYKVFWGNSIKYKGFSVGANIGLLFGKISTERITEFLENRAAYDNYFISDYSIRGFDYKIGFLYQHVLNKQAMQAGATTTPKAFNIGFTAKSTTGFSTEEEIFNRTQNTLELFGSRIDTVTNETRSFDTGKMPSEFSLGITYLSGAKFALGLDYGRTNWSNYFNPSDDETLTNTSRFSVGGYYRPDANSITSFFKRVYYRFGLYYREDPRIVETQDLNTYGISLGLGLPVVFQRKISHLSIGFDYGTRGTVDILKENFFKVSLGFTFNDDEWFIKRKFN